MSDEDRKRPIRVMMIMPSFYPVVGGMEIQVARVIPHLRDHGVEATVLTRRTAGTSRSETHDGIQIHRLAIPGGPGMRSIAFTALGTANVIRRRREIDVLHAHSLMSPTTIAAISGVLMRKPRVVTSHQSYEHDHLLKKPLGRERLRLYKHIISRWVSISSDIERLLLAHDVSPTKIVSIQNGIDTQTFSPAVGEERNRLRQERLLPPDKPIVVFAGRLQHVKNVDVLLRAWAGLNVGHLIILGDGDERESLESLAAELNICDRVDFRGMVPDVVDYLRASDVFVLPSASEGLSVALLEAMASGLVPVATAIGGTTDLIRDTENGLLVTPGDVDELRDALSRALDDRCWRNDAAHRSRELVHSRYDLRGIAEDLVNVYREVVTAPKH